MTDVHSGWPIVVLLVAVLIAFLWVAHVHARANAERLHETYRASRVRQGELDRLRWQRR